MKSRLVVLICGIFLICACVKPKSASQPEEVPDSVAGTDQTDVLIYSGPGSWKEEIKSLKEILYQNGATYEDLKPNQFNEMSIEDFLKYKVILFAGGDAPTVRNALKPETRARIREAVQKYGMNYLGFCAGAWLAVAPAPTAVGEDVVYGIGVVDGPLLKESFLTQSRNSNALDRASFPGGTQRNLLWYGGPTTPELPGGVLARYSDGSPAISQIRSGSGLVIISGLHPAATKPILSWLGLYDKEAVAPEYAWTLLQAVIENQTLPAF